MWNFPISPLGGYPLLTGGGMPGTRTRSAWEPAHDHLRHSGICGVLARSFTFAFGFAVPSMCLPSQDGMWRLQE